MLGATRAQPAGKARRLNWSVPAGLLPMLRSRVFWGAQLSIALLAIADEMLDRSGFETDVYFIPVSLVWIPIMLATFKFGILGSLGSGLFLVLISLPNWLFWHVGVARYEEIALLLVAVLASFFVGRQVDLKIAAEARVRDSSAHSVRSQEDVLRRLSLDLHDQSLQTLMAACQRIDVLRDSSPRLAAELALIRNDLNEVVADLRGIVRDLHPIMLDDLGLFPAIRQLLNDFGTRTGIVPRLDLAGGQQELSPEVEVQLFRIVQEALRNVERHSGAGKVTVSAAVSKGRIRLSVLDNGTGFNAARLPGGICAAGHYGIMGMMQRAESVKGRLKIDSHIGGGTRVLVEIPPGATVWQNQRR